jgi:hypothetical protein
MKIQKYHEFVLNEGLEWKEDLDLEFPCVISNEAPEEFPCVQLCSHDESHIIRLWNKDGKEEYFFEISPKAYKVITQNPGTEQMISIDPWSNWIRSGDHQDHIIEVREFIEDMDIETESFGPQDDLEMILDICDLSDVTVPYVDEIGPGVYLAKLSNGMESEIEMSSEGLLKKFHIFRDPASKSPLFSFELLPRQRWEFNVTESPIVVDQASLSSEKSKIIKSLIRACLTEEIPDAHKKNLVSYYETLLGDLTSMKRGEYGRKDLDRADDEILRFKSLVSKYIGEKTADELYRKAKQSIFNSK